MGTNGFYFGACSVMNREPNSNENKIVLADDIGILDKTIFADQSKIPAISKTGNESGPKSVNIFIKNALMGGKKYLLLGTAKQQELVYFFSFVNADEELDELLKKAVKEKIESDKNFRQYKTEIGRPYHGISFYETKVIQMYC